MYFITKFKDILDTVYIRAFIMAIFTYITLLYWHILPSYQMLSFLLFIGLYLLYVKMPQEKKYKRDCTILASIFSFLLILGRIAQSYLMVQDLSIWRELFGFSTLIYFLGIFFLLYMILLYVIPIVCNCKFSKQKNISSKKIFIIGFFVIFLAWIPYFLTYYPGNLSSDSMSEIKIIIENFAHLEDHHPLMHIFFMAGFYQMGMALFHNATVAIACISVAQMIIMALIFAYTTTFLYKRVKNKYIVIPVILYFAFFPAHAFYSITMWKDVLFAGFLLLLTVQAIKWIEKDCITKKDMFLFILVSLLAIFFRNNAIYMYLMFMVASLLFFKKHFKKMVCTFGIVIVIFFVVKGPVFSAFGITKSSSVESLAIPLQQIGRMAYKDIAFTKEEKESIGKMMPVKTMQNAYNPIIVDAIKFHKDFHIEPFNQNKMEYFTVWAKLCLTHFSIASEAYVMSTLGYWYPNIEYWRVTTDVYKNPYGIERNTLLPKPFEQILGKAAENGNSLLGFTWSIGLCFWIIALFGYAAVKKAGIRAIYPFVPVIGIWLTMMIATPVYAEFRYVYGAFTVLPVIIIYAITCSPKDSVTKIKNKK